MTDLKPNVIQANWDLLNFKVQEHHLVKNLQAKLDAETKTSTATRASFETKITALNTEIKAHNIKIKAEEAEIKKIQAEETVFEKIKENLIIQLQEDIKATKAETIKAELLTANRIKALSEIEEKLFKGAFEAKQKDSEFDLNDSKAVKRFISDYIVAVIMKAVIHEEEKQLEAKRTSILSNAKTDISDAMIRYEVDAVINQVESYLNQKITIKNHGLKTYLVGLFHTDPSIVSRNLRELDSYLKELDGNGSVTKGSGANPIDKVLNLLKAVFSQAQFRAKETGGYKALREDIRKLVDAEYARLKSNAFYHALNAMYENGGAFSETLFNQAVLQKAGNLDEKSVFKMEVSKEAKDKIASQITTDLNSHRSVPWLENVSSERSVVEKLIAIYRTPEEITSQQKNELRIIKSFPILSGDRIQDIKDIESKLPDVSKTPVIKKLISTTQQTLLKNEEKDLNREDRITKHQDVINQNEQEKEKKQQDFKQAHKDLSTFIAKEESSPESPSSLKANLERTQYGLHETLKTRLRAQVLIAGIRYLKKMQSGTAEGTHGAYGINRAMQVIQDVLKANTLNDIVRVINTSLDEQRGWGWIRWGAVLGDDSFNTFLLKELSRENAPKGIFSSSLQERQTDYPPEIQRISQSNNVTQDQLIAFDMKAIGETSMEGRVKKISEATNRVAIRDAVKASLTVLARNNPEIAFPQAKSGAQTIPAQQLHSGYESSLASLNSASVSRATPLAGEEKYSANSSDRDNLRTPLLSSMHPESDSPQSESSPHGRSDVVSPATDEKYSPPQPHTREANRAIPRTDSAHALSSMAAAESKLGISPTTVVNIFSEEKQFQKGKDDIRRIAHPHPLEFTQPVGPVNKIQYVLVKGTDLGISGKDGSICKLIFLGDEPKGIAEPNLQNNHKRLLQLLNLKPGDSQGGSGGPVPSPAVHYRV